MNAEPRAALQNLIAAFERHLEACSVRRGEHDPNVEAARDALADAFDIYDEALMQTYNEDTPFEYYSEDEFDEDDDFDDDLFDEPDDSDDDEDDIEEVDLDALDDVDDDLDEEPTVPGKRRR